MRIPRKAVMRPPVRKVMRLGARLEKSLAGETTFAAMLVERVATARVIRAKAETPGLPNLAMTCRWRG
jgi:hypothetical protein